MSWKISPDKISLSYADKTFTFKELMQSILACCGGSINSAYLELSRTRIDFVFLHLETFLSLQEMRRSDKEDPRAKLRKFGLGEEEINELIQ